MIEFFRFSGSMYGLGVWVWCMDRYTGMAMAKEKRETAYHEECVNTPICTAIALRSIHLFQSLLQSHCIFDP